MLTPHTHTLENLRKIEQSMLLIIKQIVLVNFLWGGGDILPPYFEVEETELN